MAGAGGVGPARAPVRHLLGPLARSPEAVTRERTTAAKLGACRAHSRPKAGNRHAPAKHADVSDSRFRYLEIGGRVRRPAVVTEEEPTTAAPVERVAFRVAETIGSFGGALGQFSKPGGISVDRSSNVYVADSCNHRVQKITPVGEVYGLGGEGLLLYPQGVAVDHAGHIYVVEQGANRLQKFGPHGQWLFAVGGPESGQPRFASPTDICIDSYHHVYIADTDNNRVSCYSATGQWQIDFHGPTSDLSLGRPQGVAVDGVGRLYVSDTMHHRILRLTPDGRFDALIGLPGPGPGELSEPRGLALDLDGGLWVADAGNDRVQKFSPEGEVVCCFPRTPSRKLDLASPSSVAVDPRGSVYVSDSLGHRILRLVPSGDRR